MKLPYHLEHSTPRKLYVGPWVGEFGVEILRWQGLARTVALSAPWQEVVVACQPARRFLYQDFASRFCDFIPTHRDAAGRSSGGMELPPDFMDEVETKNGDVWLNPQMSNEAWRLWRGYSVSRSTPRNFAANVPSPVSPVDILIHARATTKAKQGYKNWPWQHFQQLVEALPKTLKFASIGSADGAHHVSGTLDLRGISLAELAAHCAAAKLIVGPSSGPMHYAMHCGTSAVLWLPQEELTWYSPQFNPLRAPICCLPTWQPTVDLVLDRVNQMLTLAEAKNAPVKWCIFGTKRSGHHGFIEWLVKLFPHIRFTHLNDCTTGEVFTPPNVPYWLPTEQSHPKEMNRPARVQNILQWNRQGRWTEKLLSFEGAPIERISRLPEVAAAERLIFVLRDAANLIASVKKGFRHLSKVPFADASFRELLNVYRGYLREAQGATDYLGGLRSKSFFVSYNRWHTEPIYRNEVASELGTSIEDLDRGMASFYAHKSGFERHGTPAAELKTLERYRNSYIDSQFWSVAMDPELAVLESEFHREKTPLTIPWCQSEKSAE